MPDWKPVAVGGLLHIVLVSLPATLLAGSMDCGSHRAQVIRHEVGGCGRSERRLARNPHSGAVGCRQMTDAALADIGRKTRSGEWMGNPWSITSDREFAADLDAQNEAFDHCTAPNWQRLGSTRSLVGTEVGQVRVTEGGMLAATHFPGPGGLRQFAGCGLRPDCMPDAAAGANGGRMQACRIAMTRLAEGSATHVGRLTGVQTQGGGGYLADGVGAAGPAGGGAFLPWTALAIREQPPLQGERKHPR